METYGIFVDSTLHTINISMWYILPAPEQYLEAFTTKNLRHNGNKFRMREAQRDPWSTVAGVDRTEAAWLEQTGS